MRCDCDSAAKKSYKPEASARSNANRDKQHVLRLWGLLDNKRLATASVDRDVIRDLTGNWKHKESGFIPPMTFFASFVTDLLLQNDWKELAIVIFRIRKCPI